jgi:hypothetical protein
MPLIDANGARVPTPPWLVGTLLATVGLLALVGLLVGLFACCMRTKVVAASMWLAVAVVEVVASVVTVAIVPAAGYGIAPHQVRWLWPIAIWWMAAAVFATIELRPAVLRFGARRKWLAWTVGALAVVASMPPYDVPVGVARAPGSKASVAALVDQLGGVRIPPARFDPSGMWIGEPYSVPIIESLLKAGEPVRVGEDAGAQFGQRRVAGPDVTASMHLSYGSAALMCTDERTLALVSPLTAVDLDRYRELQHEVYAILANVSADPATLGESIATGIAPQLLADAGFEEGSAEASVVAEFEARRVRLDIETVALLLADPAQPSAQGCD